MIGIVVVSHSPALAQAAVDLALEMVHGTPPVIEVAAGAGEGVLGTDATRVAEAVERAAGPGGVLVFTDLGSAVLSAQMAVELSGVEQVLLTDAPFVEGITAAVVSAAQGRPLEEVAREAHGALAAKTAQLAPADGEEDAAAGRGHMPEGVGALDSEAPTDGPALSITLGNPAGLHARPAALLLGALTGLEARVWAQKEGREGFVEVTGTTAILLLGARRGDTISFRASGADASEALRRIGELAADGFGEALAEPDRPESEEAVGTAAREPVGVSPGRAVAPILRLAGPRRAPERQEIVPARRGTESSRLPVAFDAVAALYRDRARSQSGAASEILDAEASMAEDRGLLSQASRRVTQSGDDAQTAVWQVFGEAADALTASGGLLAERATDLRDVRDRIIASLAGRAQTAGTVTTRPDRYVLVAEDLAPADTVGLDPMHCVGIVTASGGPTSHTAILARSLGIPAVVAPDGIGDLLSGTELFIDGEDGRLVLDPDEGLRAEATAQDVREFSGAGHTADGRRVLLLANIGSADDAGTAVDSQAEGVGLFRTEFLFLDRVTAPGFDEQVDAYRAVLSRFPGRKVVLRTLDAGADKPLPFLEAAPEDNPALGVRGLRSARRHPDVLARQLAAIAEAARHEDADVQVMAPMVDTLEEARQFVDQAHQAGLPLAGIMVETPAAALLAGELLAAVDFVSVGTNDLTQYTMAADRLSGDLAELNDPWQPAVLRLVNLIGVAGRETGKPVGVCGEAAADPLLAAVLVGFGVTSLSMTPRSLGAVGSRLATTSFARCVSAARAAAAATDPQAARAAARALLRADV